MNLEGFKEKVGALGVLGVVVTQEMCIRDRSYMENLCISLSMRVPALWLKKSIRRSIRREYGPCLLYTSTAAFERR